MMEYCYFVGIVMGSLEKVFIWQQWYGILDQNVYFYDIMYEIVDNLDIDVIYIVVLIGFYVEYVICVANVGKYVWCEKFMAMNVEECQLIIDVCN